MRCISCFPPSIPFTVTHGGDDAKPKQYFNSVESFRPSNNISQLSCLLRCQNRRFGSFTTTATTPLFLAATSPPYTGDFTVMFQTSAVMLFAYWIANFVVPDFVMKDLKADDEDKNKEDAEKLEDEESTPRKAKNKGFGRTRE